MQRDERKRATWEGVALAGGSAFLVSTCGLANKLCCLLPPGQLYHIGSLCLVLVAAALAAVSRQDVFPRGRRAHLAAYSLFACQASLASFQAVRLMPLSDEALLAYNSIPVTTALACLYLGEPCGGRQAASCLLVVLGVLLVAQPSLDRARYPYYLVGAGVSLYGSFCESVSYVLLKRLQGVHFSVVLFNLGLTAALSSSLLFFFETWALPSNAHFLFSFVSMFVMFEVYFTLALGTERAGLVALVQASDIVFSYIFELIFFNESYNILKFLGSSLIMSVVCFSVIVRE